MGFDLSKLIGFACFGLDKAAQNVIKGVGTVLNAAGSLPKIFETICSLVFLLKNSLILLIKNMKTLSG